MGNDNNVVVGFDGLHRSGKGTQIDLLSLRLSHQNIPFAVIRGDGTRRGLGLEPYDSPSEWWKVNYDYFFEEEKSLQDKLYRRNLLYQRLMREARYYKNRRLPNIARESDVEKSFLIMDRTFISRFFSMRQVIPDICVDDALVSIDSRNNKRVSSVIPDFTFVLDVPQEILIERCERAIDQPDKKDFRMSHLLKYYGLYHSIIEELKKDDRFNIQILDGRLSPREIHEAIGKTV